MSQILRTTLRYSVGRLSISCVKQTGSFISRTWHIRKLLSNSFHFNARHFSDRSLDEQMKRIDADVRRNRKITLLELEDAIEEIKSTKSASQALMVIQWCGNLISEESPEKQTKLVRKIWNSLKKLGIKLDISHYNALLLIYVENELEFVPTDVLTELEEKRIEPDIVTYQHFITRYCYLGDKEGTARILQLMREKKMPIDGVILDTILMVNEKLVDENKVLKEALVEYASD